MRGLVVVATFLGSCGVVAKLPVAPPTLPSPVTATTVATTTTTDPPRPPEPVSRGSARNSGCGGWESAVTDVGDWNVADVCTVMQCESHFDPLAENGRYKGLMQVDGGSLDGETNLAQAFALWNETRTWRRWTCKP